MRGKAKIPSRWEGVNGITPAYAGKRSQAISTGKRNRGSPPPMRGKGRVVDVMKNGERITPAYAGKRSQAISTGKRNRGSPPPMRGKGRVVDVMKNGERITPAYAGKSAPDGCWWMLRKDHPRLCGEKWFKRETTISKRGSPPPMRGKVQTCPLERLRKRITPAYAGKSG